MGILLLESSLAGMGGGLGGCDKVPETLLDSWDTCPLWFSPEMKRRWRSTL